MSDVFKVVYEVPADLPQVQAHYEAVEKAQAATWAYVESVGAVEYHTLTWDGSLYGVVFTALNDNRWKLLERVYPERYYLCAPKKTKAAVDIRAEFEAQPKIPQPKHLALALGWPGYRPSSGRHIHFGIAQRIERPVPRVFVRLPRVIGDGWTPPDFFVERTEGEYMRAIEAHNATIQSEENADAL